MPNSERWMLQVAIVVVVTLVAHFAQRVILRRLKIRAEHTTNIWDDMLVEALHGPAAALIWITGIAFALLIVESETEAAIFAAVRPLRDVAVLVTLCWFVIRMISSAERVLLAQQHDPGAEHRLDATTITALARLSRITVLIIFVLVGLQTLGFSISGILAFGGIGGVAVGFAAKDLLSNFFGGLMLYLDRPFAIGDQIRSPDREMEGIVEAIGWRITRIRTPEKRLLYVPNSVFSTVLVENITRITHRLLNETIGIRYDDADRIGVITAQIHQMLTRHPDVDADETLVVNFNLMGPSSLDILVWAYVRSTEREHYQQVKQQLLMSIYQIIRQHGAEVAFPTQTVLMPEVVTVISPSAAAIKQ
ncbi:MAG: mechanosensitive ion channel family protein [Gammaproteobacteria bacterium]|nr:mechanosensitive ion channel family protein [Gammaproteobacteria bacterium]